jgi:hypothetical protein
MDTPLAHSIPDAVRVTGKTVSRSKIYQDIASGRLIARKHGRRTIILHTDLVKYLESLPKADARREAEAAKLQTIIMSHKT